MRKKPSFLRYDNVNLKKDKIRAQEKLCSLTVIPLVDKNEVYAVINLASHKFHDVPEYIQEAIEEVAPSLGRLINILEKS